MSEQKNIWKLKMDFYSIEDLEYLLENKPKIELDETVIEKIEAGSRFVMEMVQNDMYIYGVNTGYGSLCETRVKQEEIKKLQYNHILSHACGIGEIVPEEVSRLTLIIKLLTFRSGNTGVSLPVVQRFIDLWNNDIIPTIPKKGTVGASGDLAPLAHMGLPTVGLGSVYYKGEVRKTSDVYAELGWKSIELEPKDGLAITNGVQYIDSWAVLSLIKIGKLIKWSELIAALSVQGFSCSETFYSEIYNKTSYHTERHDVAANLSSILDGSNHFSLPTCNKSKQDPYSFRCIPQVHGAVRQTYGFAKSVMEKEFNGVSDNPLFFPEHQKILFGGALHGESTAFMMDFLAIALSELVSISERRTFQLLSGTRGLPSFLIFNPGFNSGFMVSQYSSAALVNENKVLCTPASIDTIPTCQMQEDSVSMGGTSAYKLFTIIENSEYILGNELFTAAQAIELNKGLELSPVTQEIFNQFRKEVPFIKEDCIMSEHMETARTFLKDHINGWIDNLR
jgi:histidine ammonia-lyase